MSVKTIQNLVSDAMNEIKTIDAGEAYQMVQNKNCNLIDIRESNELENTGRVEGASHIPRGMLEVYLDPNSPIFQNGQIDQNKEFVLFCAGGVRSALAVKSLKDMGYQKVSHIDGGFASIASSKFKII
jgi:rhodanese-related sulfurtransferase